MKMLGLMSPTYVGIFLEGFLRKLCPTTTANQDFQLLKIEIPTENWLKYYLLQIYVDIEPTLWVEWSLMVPFRNCVLSS